MNEFGSSQDASFTNYRAQDVHRAGLGASEWMADNYFALHSPVVPNLYLTQAKGHSISNWRHFWRLTIAIATVSLIEYHMCRACPLIFFVLSRDKISKKKLNYIYLKINIFSKIKVMRIVVENKIMMRNLKTVCINVIFEEKSLNFKWG